jgi:hypothetical protein
MKAETGRKLDMGARALIFSRLHAEPSVGYARLLARLERQLVRGTHLQAQQRDGMIESHQSAVRKRDLQSNIRRGHLTHLRSIAGLAEADLPEFHQLLRLKRGCIPFRTFRTAARAMANEALSRKDVLVKHGLSETMLQNLVETLDELDEVIERGSSARVAHVGASADLDIVADEVVRIVRALDGLNYQRFAKDGELWASWRSLSHVALSRRSPPRAA